MGNQIRQTIAEVFEEMAEALETGSFGKKTRVGLTILGSEHGPEELVRGAEHAQKRNSDIQVVVIGGGAETDLEMVAAADEKEAHAKMDEMLGFPAFDPHGSPIPDVNGKIVIPVVVNVLQRTSETKLSDAQIQTQIDVLNKDFNGTNSEYASGIPAEFNGLKANVGISFELVNIIRKSTTKTS